MSFDCKSNINLVQERKPFFSHVGTLSVLLNFLLFSQAKNLAALFYFPLIFMPYSISKHTSCIFPLKGLAKLSLHSYTLIPLAHQQSQLTPLLDFTEESNLVIFNIITYMSGYKCFLFVLPSCFYSFFFPSFSQSFHFPPL